MDVIYVCNCCGARNINPQTMKNIKFEMRILHICSYCEYNGYQLKDFKAIFCFDEVIN